VIGLNTGSGIVFRTKAWPVDRFVELTRYLSDELNTTVFLLGGPREITRNKEIKDKAGKLPLFDIGCNHSLLDFAAIISELDLLVTSDTMAMHLGIAMGKFVTAMFGSTCHQEIDMQGHGIKLFKGLPCSPCYKNECEDLSCMDAITVNDVFEVIKSYFKRTKNEITYEQSSI